MQNFARFKGVFLGGVARFSSAVETTQTFVSHLWKRLDSLGHASHVGDNEMRRMIVGRYYSAYSRIEEQVASENVKEHVSHFYEFEKAKKEVKFYRVESFTTKALGIAVIAKSDEEILGRMFIAHIPNNNKNFNHNHLSILSVKDGDEILQMEIASKIFETYFSVEKQDEKEILMSTRLAKSCIGAYSPSLQKILNYDNSTCDSAILSVGELYKASCKILENKKSPATDISDFKIKALKERYDREFRLLK